MNVPTILFIIFIKFYFVSNYMHECGSECGYVHVSAGMSRRQRRCSSPQEKESECGYVHVSAGMHRGQRGALLPGRRS